MLTGCRRKYIVREDCEITLESNPGTISADKTMACLDFGVNRISMGAQSFVDSELDSIGRLHTPAMIEESLRLLRESGFSNINLDLMLGLPNQTLKSWKSNLERVVALDVPHVSVYMLDLDDECLLGASVAQGLVRLPEEDLVADLYLFTIDFLSSRGYRQYEISNFALPGFACRHNLKYWTRKPVLGYGLASHSFDGHSRYANYRRMDDYLLAIEAGISPVDWREQLDEARALEETFFLGLRLNDGVNWSWLQDRFGRDGLEKHEKAIRKLIDEGLLERKDSILRLTSLGRLLSNEVFQRFI